MSASVLTRPSGLDLSAARAPQWLEATLGAMVAPWDCFRLGAGWIVTMTPSDLCLARDPFRNDGLRRVVGSQHAQAADDVTRQPKASPLPRGTVAVAPSSRDGAHELSSRLPASRRATAFPHRPEPAGTRPGLSSAARSEPATRSDSASQVLVLAPRLLPEMLHRLASSAPRASESEAASPEHGTSSRHHRGAPHTGSLPQAAARRAFNRPARPHQKPSSGKVSPCSPGSNHGDLWVDRLVRRVARDLTLPKGNNTAPSSSVASARLLESGPGSGLDGPLLESAHGLKNQWACSLAGQRAAVALPRILPTTRETHGGDSGKMPNRNHAAAQSDGQWQNPATATALGSTGERRLSGAGQPVPSLEQTSLPSLAERETVAGQRPYVDPERSPPLDGSGPAAAGAVARETRDQGPAAPQPTRERASLLPMKAEPPASTAPGPDPQVTAPGDEDLSLLADKIQHILEQEARRHGLDI